MPINCTYCDQSADHNCPTCSLQFCAKHWLDHHHNALGGPEIDIADHTPMPSVTAQQLFVGRQSVTDHSWPKPSGPKPQRKRNPFGDLGDEFE